MSITSEQTEQGTKKKRTRSPRTITCALCQKRFAKLTHSHMQTHGMTLAQYQRTFRADTAPRTHAAPPGRPPLDLEPPARLDPALVRATAEELVSSDAFVSALGDEVGELLFTGHFKERLRLSLAQLLGTRLTLHSQAVAHLQAVREELAQPWRLEAGGKDGEPTPTPHLVGMAGEAHHEVTKAEEALLKVTRLALEEQKHSKEQAAHLSGRPSYSGEQVSVPVPPELDAGERETVRSLIHLLQLEVQARAEKNKLGIKQAQLTLEGRTTQEGRTTPVRLAGSTALPDLPPEEPPPAPPPAGDDLPLA